LLHNIKKKLQWLFKLAAYNFFFLIYGRIKGIQKAQKLKNINIKKIKLGAGTSYNVYEIKNSSLYTDRINDTAVIVENKIIDGPSFQLRNTKNSKCKENIVLRKGTPKLRKKINGTVLSLLTGGAGNSNYFHWLYDVLPRLYIAEKYLKRTKIDYYLFPSLEKKFQKQSLDLMGIPKEKRLSSEKIRHFKCDNLLVTDHPYVKNNPIIDIQNIPHWILRWLKKNLIKNKKNLSKFPKKIYIDRKDSEANHRHLRSIINENELKKFLKNQKFKSICLSDYDFEDQIKLFYNTKFITGLHGAGFANFVFCKPKTKVIEFRPNTAGPMFENLAKNNKLLYKSIDEKPIKHSHHNNQLGHIKVNITKLKKKIIKL